MGHDGVGLDFTKGALGIDSLQQKILKVSAHLRAGQGLVINAFSSDFLSFLII